MVGVVPQELTQAMIDELVGAFATAARRCEQGGLDGVELHGAHGYLIGQFLSPATNRREDGYGGSLENRTRFLREILAAIRAETSPGFPVGLRISADDQIEGGVDPGGGRRHRQAGGARHRLPRRVAVVILAIPSGCCPPSTRGWATRCPPAKW